MNETPQATPPSDNDPFAVGAQTMADAETILRQDAKAWPSAIKKLEKAISILESTEGDPARQSELIAWAHMHRGNILCGTDSREAIEQGLASYQVAIEHFDRIAEGRPERQGDLAAALSNAGHARMRLPNKEHQLLAENHFRQAIAVLERLPWQENERYRHHLAATWLNLANALARHAPPANPSAETVAAFDQALSYAEGLSAEDQNMALLAASIRSSLGRALQWCASKPLLERSARELDQAAVQLEKLPFQKNPRIAMELAATHASRANLLSRAQPSKDSIEGALRSGDIALQIASPHEESNLMAAEVSLSARRAVCQVFGMIVNNQSSDAQRQIHDKASDLVEDGLKLAKLWEGRQASSLRPAAQHLFHLGCGFYSSHQPQFLAEFVQENIDLQQPDTVMADSARSALSRAIESVKGKETPDANLLANLQKALEQLPAAS